MPTTPAKKKVAPKNTTTTTTQPKGDSKETKAYIAKKAAEKDADVKNYKHQLAAELKKGVTAKSADSATKLVSKGSVKQQGVAFNFLTGQSAISDFDKVFKNGGPNSMVTDKRTGKIVAKSGIQGPGTSTQQAFGSYLNPKHASRMTNTDLRHQFVSDSIADRGEKEKRVAYFENAMKRSRR
jgi:hypothetical protein